MDLLMVRGTNVYIVIGDSLLKVMNDSLDTEEHSSVIRTSQ